jgi:hypothetical protein
VLVRQEGAYPAEWALLTPDGPVESEAREQTFQRSPGNYTLILTEPPGYRTVTEVLVNGEARAESSSRTTSTSIESGTLTFHIRVLPDPEELGAVSVNSTPSGLTVLLRGPLWTKTVTTPFTAPQAPPGLYTAQVKLASLSCPDPRPMSQRLIENGRASFLFTMDLSRCEALEEQMLSAEVATRRELRKARRVTPSSNRMTSVARAGLPSSLAQTGRSETIEPCVPLSTLEKQDQQSLLQQFRAAEEFQQSRAERLERRSWYFKRLPPEGTPRSQLQSTTRPRNRD